VFCGGSTVLSRTGSFHISGCHPNTIVTVGVTNSGLTEKVVVDYENKRLVKEQHDQIESLKIVQAAASDTESAMGKSERTVVFSTVQCYWESCVQGMVVAGHGRVLWTLRASGFAVFPFSFAAGTQAP
jgi:hypothetical protein